MALKDCPLDGQVTEAGGQSVRFVDLKSKSNKLKSSCWYREYCSIAEFDVSLVIKIPYLKDYMIC